MPNPTVMPYLTVSDGEAALDFYEKAFGAKVEQKMPAEDGKRLLHAHLTLNGSPVMLSDDFGGGQGGTRAPAALGGTTVTIHLEVPDADAAAERAVKAGARVIMPVADMFWGARYGKLEDPFGHVWSIASPLKKAAG